MPIKRWPSLTAMFYEQAATFANKPFLHAKSDGAWKTLSWRETAEKVAKLAAGLERLGVGAGDRVVIVSENRPEWFIADLAIMTLGAITVPAYTTYTARDYLHILENSGAKAAVVSTKSLARTFLKAAHQSDDLEHTIVIEPTKIEQSLNVALHDWDTVLSTEDADIGNCQARVATTSRDDIACLIYTSGTGGAPKGVMIHHGAILHNCEGAATVIKELGLKGNSFLSFLPLSHAYEHTAGQCLPLSLGAEIWYAESLDKLAANMAETKPTIMVVVPRLFEMLRTRISRSVLKGGGAKARLFERCIELGTRISKGEKLSVKEKIENAVLSLVVRRKVKGQFGGRLKALVSGGAPLAPDVGYFFAALGLPLLQGYGQTEAGPVISVNPPSAPKLHTVGKIFEQSEVMIAEDGEILVRGEQVMKGYWRDERTTERTIVNGWLHTGDIGRFDEDGYLEITDRKKDIIVNDKGDNVSPQRIEGMLALEDEIAQAMVYGDRRPHLVGLIVPDVEWLAGWAKENGKEGGLKDLASDPDLRKALDTAVARVNHRLSNLEKIRQFIIAPESFTIENEQMTPTLKLRRHVVKEVYGEALEGLYKRG
ncbi:AMP-dependent synthetase/ligase [Kordiimonas marina]|uniref:AMP-dependent synthetase/ligase n=1 Tax=Kordiimonas marina TaxID=2872312 RepID=UPI001FF5B5D9|nr:long-chain fatty acid--CoA ligase [Kordiimonas marina]MCJ9429932.1 long-chain fatty acid--CoA ligase [Kordiimonas marina]